MSIVKLIAILAVVASVSPAHARPRRKPARPLKAEVEQALARGDIVETCRVGIYGTPGDPHHRGKTAWKHVHPSTVIGVAHRSLPFGTRLKVCSPRTLKCAWLQVIDRGPYGKLDHQGRWFNARIERARQGTWRSCLDFTPKAARTIGITGMEFALVVIPTRRKPLAPWIASHNDEFQCASYGACLCRWMPTSCQQLNSHDPKKPSNNHMDDYLTSDERDMQTGTQLWQSSPAKPEH